MKGNLLRYSQIDETLSKWSAENSLIVMKIYKGMEVRSIELTDKKGARYQIWIELQDGDNAKIHAWDFGKRRTELSANSSDLKEKLDNVLFRVKGWMDSR